VTRCQIFHLVKAFRTGPQGEIGETYLDEAAAELAAAELAAAELAAAELAAAELAAAELAAAEDAAAAELDAAACRGRTLSNGQRCALASTFGEDIRIMGSSSQGKEGKAWDHGKAHVVKDGMLTVGE
jgi:membrane protein involved in colicin uptake